MKISFSHIYFLLAVLIGSLSIASCDKMDDNGPFYGYWLLTDVEGPEGPIGTAPEKGSTTVNTDLIDFNMPRTITWGVRNELIVIHEINQADYYFFTFTRTDKELQLREAYHNDGSKDKLIEFSEVPEKFYVPADGHYDVVNLDGNGMTLRSGSLGLTLKLKKN